jgi:tRNA threonylcarbamoyl adenosine modification protein YeaZ
VTVPVLVALEASQRTGGVAVRDGRGDAHVEWMSPASRFDDDLLPAIGRLYERVGLAPKDTEAVGVSIGPGGFTGLRIAVSTAKMLAEGLGARLVAVPSALVAAGSHDGPGPILVALSAKGATAWVTRLARDAGNAWAVDVDGALVDADGLNLEGVGAVLADRYLPPPMRRRCAEAGVTIIDPIFSPLACLDAAARRLDASLTTDPLVLAPLYPRPPAAVSIWELRHRP